MRYLASPLITLIILITLITLVTLHHEFVHRREGRVRLRISVTVSREVLILDIVTIEKEKES